MRSRKESLVAVSLWRELLARRWTRGLDEVTRTMDQERMAEGAPPGAVKQETVAIVGVGVALLVALASFLLSLRGDVRMLSSEVHAPNGWPMALRLREAAQ